MARDSQVMDDIRRRVIQRMAEGRPPEYTLGGAVGDVANYSPLRGGFGREYSRISDLQAGRPGDVRQQAALEAQSRAQQMEGIGALGALAAEGTPLADAQATMARNRMMEAAAGAGAQSPGLAIRALGQAGAAQVGQDAAGQAADRTSRQQALSAALGQAQRQDLQRAGVDLAQAGQMDQYELQRQQAALAALGLGLDKQKMLIDDTMTLFGAGAMQPAQPNFWTQQFLPGMLSMGAGLGASYAAGGGGHQSYQHPLDNPSNWKYFE